MSNTKLDKHFKELEDDMLNLKKSFFSIIKKFNLVKKEFNKINGNQNKVDNKGNKSNKRNKGNKKICKKEKKSKENKDDNNFNEPILSNFSKEICNILKLESDKELVFSEFNKKINQYLTNNNLLINEKINSDNMNDEFKSIFSKNTKDKKLNTITIKNIHNYLKHNYTIKKI